MVLVILVFWTVNTKTESAADRKIERVGKDVEKTGEMTP